MSEEYEKLEKKTIDTGAVIDKCENILITAFILIEAYTALALVFAAKSIVRSRAMREHPEHYLVGTMVNFTFSILMDSPLRNHVNCPLSNVDPTTRPRLLMPAFTCDDLTALVSEVFSGMCLCRVPIWRCKLSAPFFFR